MGYTFAIYNQKGGVGKTSTSIHTAVALAEMGVPTLLVDLDPNRNACKVFEKEGESPKYSLKDILSDKGFDPNVAICPAYADGSEPIENLHVIHSDISLAVLQSTISGHVHKEKFLKRQLDKITNEHVVLIDMPATMCDLALNGVYAADYLVIVSSYETDSVAGISDLFRFVSEIKETQNFDYKILRNKKDGRKKSNIEYLQFQLEDFEKKGKLFETIIYCDNTIERAKRENKTVFTFDPNCKVKSDYMQFANELKEIYLHGKS